MTTLWIARLFFFVPVSALTQTVRDNIADGFADNGSLENHGNELGAFINPVRLSVSGNLPATAIGINAAVKPAMRAALRALIVAIPASRYYVVSNTLNQDQGWMEGQLLQSDSAVLTVGSVITWLDALADILASTGLRVIQPAAI